MKIIWLHSNTEPKLLLDCDCVCRCMYVHMYTCKYMRLCKHACIHVCFYDTWLVVRRHIGQNLLDFTQMVIVGTRMGHLNKKKSVQTNKNVVMIDLKIYVQG